MVIEVKLGHHHNVWLLAIVEEHTLNVMGGLGTYLVTAWLAAASVVIICEVIIIIY